MPKYQVLLHITGTQWVYVEADSEDQAKKKATYWNDVDEGPETINDWEVVSVEEIERQA